MRSRIKRAALAIVSVVPVLIATGGAHRGVIEPSVFRNLFAGRRPPRLRRRR